MNLSDKEEKTTTRTLSSFYKNLGIEYNPNSPINIPVFVYGTLRVGFGLNNTLKEYKSVYRGLFKTQDKYTMFDTGSFPAIIPYKHGVNVVGEIYWVSKECLAMLDFIESHPEMYQRTAIALVSTVDSACEGAYSYIWNDKISKNMRAIECGDWTTYKNSPAKDAVREKVKKEEEYFSYIDDFSYSWEEYDDEKICERYDFDDNGEIIDLSLEYGEIK